MRDRLVSMNFLNFSVIICYLSDRWSRRLRYLICSPRLLFGTSEPAYDFAVVRSFDVCICWVERRGAQPHGNRWREEPFDTQKYIMAVLDSTTEVLAKTYQIMWFWQTLRCMVHCSRVVCKKCHPNCGGTQHMIGISGHFNYMKTRTLSRETKLWVHLILAHQLSDASCV